MDETRYAKLTPLQHQQSLNRQSFATFDVECKDGLKGTKLFCYAFAFRLPKSSITTARVYEANDLTRFFNFLRLRLNKKDVKEVKFLNIYVHNLGFDIRFVQDYVLRHDIKTTPILSGSKMVAYLIDELKVRFIDSFQFLLSSQENAEISFAVDPKLRKIDCKDLFDIPFHIWSRKDKDRVLAHNKNDVLALWEIMDKFRKETFEITNVDIISVLTPATLAMKSYRKTLKEEILNPFIYYSSKDGKPTYNLDNEKDEFVRKSYFGGRTEVFDLRPQNNCNYFDVVSLFPSVMRFNEYPVGIPEWYNDHDYIFKEFKEGKLGFAKIEFTPSDLYYPILPTKIDERVCFTNVPNQIGYYSSYEIMYAISLGYEVNFIKALIFPEKKILFDEYIDNLFEVKSTTKGGRKAAAKLGMNGLYGKFGQDPSRQSFEFNFFKDKIEALDYCEDVENPFVKFSSEYGKWFTIILEDNIVLKPFMIISIAAITTSLARIELHKQMHHLLTQHGIYTRYCDTDSVVAEPIAFPLLLNKGKKLGQWDIEEKFTYFHALAPKSYIFKVRGKNKIKCKLKGIPRKKLDKLVEQSNNNIEKFEELIREPIQLAERYATFKQSLKAGLALTTRKMAKHYSFIYQKRKVKQDGRTEPITQI